MKFIFSYFRPSKFQSEFAKLYPQFRGYRQEDSFEFYKLLTNALQQGMKSRSNIMDLSRRNYQVCFYLNLQSILSDFLHRIPKSNNLKKLGIGIQIRKTGLDSIANHLIISFIFTNTFSIFYVFQFAFEIVFRSD